MSSAAQARERRGALWMLLACASFAPMAVCVKVGLKHYGLGEVLLVRGLTGVLVFGALAGITGLSLRTMYAGAHVKRGAVGALAVGSWFYAMSVLPIGTAFMLYYTSSLWVAATVVIGALWGSWQHSRLRATGKAPQKEDWSMSTVTTRSIVANADLSTAERVRAVLRRQWPLMAALACGFVGVGLVLSPNLGGSGAWQAWIGLGAGMAAAWAFSHVAGLARRGEPELRIVFYFMLTTAVLGFGLWLASGLRGGFHAWSAHHLGWLVAAALLAALGQWAMTRAYAQGSTLLVANLQYSAVVFATMLGVWLFDERLPSVAVAGMAVIVASAVAAALIRRRQDASAAATR